MPAFQDDLYLGGATLTPTDPADFPSGYGIGPLGRMYLWDAVPLALNAANVAASQTPAAAGSLTLTAGTGVTSVVNARGETVLQLDVPRAVEVVQAAAGTQRIFTITGYDYAGQKMSEAITSTVNATVAGKKAFKQVLSVAVSGATTTACTVGTTDILGVPVRVTDAGYVIHAGWAAALADDAGTLVAADTTDPATTTTGDVRGTYVPSSATDGVKRLVMAIGTPGLAAGPNATRAGAFGVTQNLGTT